MFYHALPEGGFVNVAYFPFAAGDKSPVRSPVITSAAASGVTAKTPECIFTPAGTPSTNGGSVCSARAEATSRPCRPPSERAKGRYPQPPGRVRRAAYRPPCFPPPRRRARKHSVPPRGQPLPHGAAPGQNGKALELPSPARVRVMRPGARGSAPRARASARTADPSEPFRAVAPPIPARDSPPHPSERGSRESLLPMGGHPLPQGQGRGQPRGFHPQ